MLLTITTTHQPATDLGYLLHKNPTRLQTVEVSGGQAHVFYPEATAERCTAALLLDLDPVGLVRGRNGAAGEGFALEQYVNDRPYAASSLLAVAIKQVFGSALAGRSASRPERAAARLPLELHVPALPQLRTLSSSIAQWTAELADAALPLPPAADEPAVPDEKPATPTS